MNSNFMHYDLGSLEKGRVVEITLQGNAANVQCGFLTLSRQSRE